MMRTLLAVDPGPEQTAWVLFKDGKPDQWFTKPNDEAIEVFRDFAGYPIVIEMIASYGMAVGREVFETCVWIGRFIEATGGDAKRITRGEVKDAICHSRKATDANIRTELIDRFGPGKEKAIGKKKTPGPLFGMKGDEWAALAVGVAWLDRLAAEAGKGGE